MTDRLRAALDATDALPEDAPPYHQQRDLYAAGWHDRGDALRQLASPPPLDRLRRIEAAAHALVDDDGFTKDREREWRDLEAALKEPSDD